MLTRKTQWCRRPKGTPCPICGRDSWCTISEDKMVARCVRARSDRPAPSKDGDLAWIHELSGSVISVELLPTNKTEYKDTREVRAMVMACYHKREASIARYQLSNMLGVSVKALESMKVGFGVDGNGREYTSWPSKNEKGEFVGITRRYFDNEKKTIFGTRAGLFYPESTGFLLRQPTLIVEGGSDVAAAFTIGLYAIGRPSNTGGAEMLKAMQLGDVVVLGEDDEQPSKRGQYSWCPANCAGCSHCFPGLFGARVTAKQLGCRYLMPPKGCKDLRDVLAQRRVSEFLGLVTRT